MSYFNFNYVTDPPNDELVNVETQLNDNWEEVDAKITPFNQKPANFGNIPLIKGIEAFRPESGFEHRMSVWNGSAWYSALSHSSWTQWQTVTIRSPVVIRTGFPVVARVSSTLNKVEVSGAVLFDVNSSAWPTTTTVEITSDTAIQGSFAPDNPGQQIFRQMATGVVTTANGFAGAVAIVERKSNPDRTAISIRYQGDPGGGNFVALDGLNWWFKNV